jgi:hypothetical protein
MIWSISSARAFQRCQRKWFLNEKVGSTSNKNVYRKEIYLLSQLESIHAWRGKIVDYTISEFIIPRLQKKQKINIEEILSYARKLAAARYRFAKDQKYKDKNLKKTKHEYEYSALYPFEFVDKENGSDSLFKKAWDETTVALTNFVSNDYLLDYLRNANYLVTQRSLMYKFHDVNIKGIPDLIAFFPNDPPHIFDWKVHFWGVKSYNEQLVIYALALIKCKAHKDFPDNISEYSVTDVKLSEYQLLNNTIREYSITEENIEELNDFIADSILNMKLKKCNMDYLELNIEEFEKTPYLDNCKFCQFKKICQED